jgi:hypothetical protein
MNSTRDLKELRQALYSASNLPERLWAFVHLATDPECTFGDMIDALKFGGLVASHAFVTLANHFQIRPKFGTDSENLEFWRDFLEKRHISLDAKLK